MRLQDHKTTALIFGSGKVYLRLTIAQQNALVTPLYWIALQIVITGGISEESYRLSARKFTRVYRDFPAQFSEFKVRNVMGTCDVLFPIRLEGLLNDHARFSIYEPELFPGLIYKLVEPKLTLLIFVLYYVALATQATFTKLLTRCTPCC
ncbi:hypothetical protein PsorP6_007388 [Peronosclerospora sorghi]|uniref:Uncharacterized protein n=1 Tax=Peronosclerospora sorghi TaxID=230839 RepID=A0ACC0W9C1_9STRA|nr:hypothetical protein PsorP6_007388 [Peronosclerospora sorghi]